MKRIAAIILVALLSFAGVAAAASVMNVSVNGKAVTFKTAPVLQNNVLMVPVDDVTAALGLEAKWNMGTNTLEITDPRQAELDKTKADLAAAQKELADLKAKMAPAAPPAPPAITAENLLAELNKQYGKLTIDGQSLTVVWTGWTASDGTRWFSAQTDISGDVVYLSMRIAHKEGEVKAWFEKATGMIAQVYPKNVTAAFVAVDTLSSYPRAKWDSVKLTDDLKYRVTDYILWYSSDIGVFWDSTER